MRDKIKKFQLVCFKKFQISEFRQTQQINNSIILKQLSLNPNHQFCKNFPPISTLEIFSAKNSCRFTMEKFSDFFYKKFSPISDRKNLGKNFAKTSRRFHNEKNVMKLMP